MVKNYRYFVGIDKDGYANVIEWDDFEDGWLFGHHGDGFALVDFDIRLNTNDLEEANALCDKLNEGKDL